MKKAIKLMLLLAAVGAMATGCGKEDKKAGGDEPVTYNTAILYNEQHSSYDKKAEACTLLVGSKIKTLISPV